MLSGNRIHGNIGSIAEYLQEVDKIKEGMEDTRVRKWMTCMYVLVMRIVTSNL
jgi:hypothetical protein